VNNMLSVCQVKRAAAAAAASVLAMTSDAIRRARGRYVYMCVHSHDILLKRVIVSCHHAIMCAGLFIKDEESNSLNYYSGGCLPEPLFLLFLLLLLPEPAEKSGKKGLKKDIKTDTKFQKEKQKGRKERKAR
jgi:hypothetical protein